MFATYVALHYRLVSYAFSAGNPFGDDDEWGYDGVGNEQQGAAVRALYDYQGEEADELSFRAGECFVSG